VPVIQMLSLTADELEQRARSLIEAVSTTGLQLELVPGASALGGGAGPTSTLPTKLVALTHPKKSAQEIEHQLRTSSPPIIARISEGRVLLDLRTVSSEEIPPLSDALKNLEK